MTDHAPPDPSRRENPTSPGAIMLPAMEMWQESLKLGTAWWNAAVDLWWPENPFRPMSIHHDPHHQLIIPEPIESDDERALVA